MHLLYEFCFYIILCFKYVLQKILFLMCAGNELFYCMLYLTYFTSGPQGLLTLVKMFLHYPCTPCSAYLFIYLT